MTDLLSPRAALDSYGVPSVVLLEGDRLEVYGIQYVLYDGTVTPPRGAYLLGWYMVRIPSNAYRGLLSGLADDLHLRLNVAWGLLFTQPVHHHHNLYNRAPPTRLMSQVEAHAMVCRQVDTEDIVVATFYYNDLCRNNNAHSVEEVQLALDRSRQIRGVYPKAPERDNLLRRLRNLLFLIAFIVAALRMYPHVVKGIKAYHHARYLAFRWWRPELFRFEMLHGLPMRVMQWAHTAKGYFYRSRADAIPVIDAMDDGAWSLSHPLQSLMRSDVLRTMIHGSDLLRPAWPFRLSLRPLFPTTIVHGDLAPIAPLMIGAPPVPRTSRRTGVVAQAFPLFGGPLSWGWCFSCGGCSSARMAHKMCTACHSSRSGNPVVRNAAAGQPVASSTQPLVYEGVINTPSRHPPLKKGVETIATRKTVKVRGMSALQVATLEPRERAGPRLTGIGISGAIAFISSVGPRPLYEAIVYRIFKKLTGRLPPQQGSFDVCNSNLDLLLPHFFDPVEVMPIWDWLHSITVSRRRHILIREYYKYITYGRGRDFDRISAFVKTENLPYFAPMGELPSVADVTYVARLIQAPHDHTHIIAGPYLKPLTKRLKTTWGIDNWVMYGSRKPEELDQWLNERLVPCESYFWADYSAFDATHSKNSWSMIEAIYERLYPKNQQNTDFWDVLGIWRSPKGKCQVRREMVTISYKAPICNASGRDDTALANALFNGLALTVSIAAAVTGKRPDLVTRYDLLYAESVSAISVVGDDSIVGFKFDAEALFPSIVEALQTFGLMVKSGGSKNIYDITYLGQMPYRVAGRWLWGPTLGRRMYKAYWQVDRSGHPVAWTKGVAQQMALSRHVPIMYDCAIKILTLLPKQPATPVPHDENKPWTAREEQTPLYDNETIKYLSMRYECPEQLPLSDIEEVRAITKIPVLRYGPFIRLCLARDDL